MSEGGPLRNVQPLAPGEPRERGQRDHEGETRVMANKGTPEETKRAERDALPGDSGESTSRRLLDAERELAAAGFDVRGEGGSAGGFREGAGAGSATGAGQQPVSLSYIRSLRPPPPRPILIWVAGVAVVLAVGGGWLVGRIWPGEVAVAPSLALAPASVRQQAIDACHQRRWRECLAGLDSARRLDPKGDADPVVQQARAVAAHEIASP